jgi:hypothetical protein
MTEYPEYPESFKQMLEKYKPKFYYKSGIEFNETYVWGRLMEDRSYSIIKQEDIRQFFISTVWLGMDHGWMNEKPLIFETMIFTPDDKDNKFVDYQTRYATEEEAIEGHIRAVNLVKEWILENPSILQSPSSSVG